MYPRIIWHASLITIPAFTFSFMTVLLADLTAKAQTALVENSSIYQLDPNSEQSTQNRQLEKIVNSDDMQPVREFAEQDVLRKLARPVGRLAIEFKRAVETAWLPALNRFAPRLIFVSAGFDGHAEDEMAGLMLQADDYAWVTRKIVESGHAHADGRIVSVLEGGYELPALGRSAVEHVRALMGL